MGNGVFSRLRSLEILLICLSNRRNYTYYTTYTFYAFLHRKIKGQTTMAFGKIKPKKMTKEALADLSAQAQEQKFFTATPKSEDPVNYPVFTLGFDQYLVYVPNHTVMNEDGIPELRQDKPFIHSIEVNKRFHKIRCTDGIESAELGLDGTCPICDGRSVVDEYARIEADRLLVSQGFEAGDTSDDARKLTKGIYEGRAIKRKSRNLTFPIVVFERSLTKNAQGRDVYKLNLNEDGEPIYKIMWYSISEALYSGSDSRKGLWKGELDKRADEFDQDYPTPAGLWFTIEGRYVDDPQKWSARDAATQFTVSMLPNGPKNLEKEYAQELALRLDQETESWTPEKAIEVVIANHFLPVEDVRESTEEILQPLRDKIALHQANLGAGTTAPAIEATVPNAGQKALAALDDDEIDDLED